MSTFQLTTSTRLHFTTALVIAHSLLYGFFYTIVCGAEQHKDSGARAVISERYDALAKGDIHRFSALHKDTTWIKEREFQELRQAFLRYRIIKERVITASKQGKPLEVYIGVDEFYKGQPAPTRMHYTVRSEKDRWIIDEFNADEAPSPTEKEVEEAAKRMLKKK